MNRAWGPLATRSIASARRRRPWALPSLAGIACGVLLLGACGGDDDDDASSTTTDATVASTVPSTNTLPEVVETIPSTQAPTPTSVQYVTEGASVLVTNASRVDGAAGRLSDRLAAVGFTTVEPGDYTLGTIEATVIYHDPANPQALAVAQSLMAAFGGGGIQVLEMPAPPPVDTGDLLGAGVLVAMGNDIADKTLEELQGLAPATTEPSETTETTEATDGATESTTETTAA